MLIPRFSLRWLLGLTTFCAAASLILAAAVRGEFWAVGAAAALASLAVLALLHITTFAGAWLLSGVERSLFQRSRGTSPFATKVPAPPLDSPSPQNPPAMTG
jgi:hypothetical protein